MLSEGCLVDGCSWYLRKCLTTTAVDSVASSSGKLSLECFDIGPELCGAQIALLALCKKEKAMQKAQKVLNEGPE